MAVKNNNKDLASLIKKTRKVAGLNQLELAQKAGVGKTLVFNLEKGSKKVSFENVMKILKVLNIKIDFQLPFNTDDES